MPAFAANASEQRIVNIASAQPFWLTKEIRILDPLPDGATVSDAERFLQEGKWQWNGNGHVGFGYLREDVWLSFSYLAEQPLEPVVNIDYADLDQVSVYTREASGSAWTRQAVAGDTVEAEGSLIHHRTIAVRLPAAGANPVDVMVHVNSLAVMKVPVLLTDAKTFSSIVLKESILDGIYFGVFGIVILMNLMFYVYFRKMQYLYYSGFALSFGLFIAMYKGYDSAFLTAGLYDFNKYAVYLMIYSCTIFLLLFSASFLHLREYKPEWLRPIRGYIVFNLALVPLIIWGPYQIIAQIASADALIVVVVCLIIGLRMGSGQRFARIYTAANFVYILAVIIVAGSSLGLVSSMPWMENLLQIGAFIQTMMLFAVLIHEIRVIQKEKEQSDSERLAMQQERESQMAAWNRQLSGQVAERTKALQQLLDHSTEGFFKINEQFVIADEYSAECNRLFGTPFAGQKVIELLEPEDTFQQRFLLNVLNDIFKSPSDFQRDVILSLLPDRLKRQEVIVQMRYRWVAPSAGQAAYLLAIATDVTNELQLKKQMENERLRFEMVIQVFSHADEFVELLHSMEDLVSADLPSWIAYAFESASVYQECFRTVHTLKGTASQMKLYELSNALHQLEDQIMNRQWQDDPLMLVTRAWENDLSVIHSWLGDKMTRQDAIVSIERRLLIQMRDRLNEHRSPWTFDLVELLNRHLQKTVHEMMALYPAFVERVAQSLDKWILPLEIEGGHYRVEPEQLQPLIKSLVHVFRNMIDHGIERVDERVEKGKPDFGKITCRIGQSDQHIEFIISDDGKGIHPELIRNKALTRGWISEQQALTMRENELIDLIWHDGFSTREVVTELSGRGIGLAAVRNEVIRAGGEVQVETAPGKGTSFRFRIPVRHPG